MEQLPDFNKKPRLLPKFNIGWYINYIPIILLVGLAIFANAQQTYFVLNSKAETALRFFIAIIVSTFVAANAIYFLRGGDTMTLRQFFKYVLTDYEYEFTLVRFLVFMTSFIGTVGSIVSIVVFIVCV